MKNSGHNHGTAGGAKKFLYSAPKKGEEEEELPWNFKPQKQTVTSPTAKFDVDSAWSIQRNVNIGPQMKSPKSEQLNYNTSKGYYSRYGGNKEKDEFGEVVNTDKGGGGGNSDTSGGKSWGVGSQSRRPFSYSFGTEAQTTQGKPISPRHVSNSSASVYPQTQTSLPKVPIHDGAFTSRPVNNTGSSGSTMNSGSNFGSGSTMHSGNNNMVTSSKGSNSNSSDNSSNSHGQTRPSFLDSSPATTNGHSHSNMFESSSTSSNASTNQSRPSFLDPSPNNKNNNKNSSLSSGRTMNSQVANVGGNQSFGGPARNSLFSSSQPKGRRDHHNDLFGINENWSANSKTGTAGRTNKSFW